MMSTFPSDPIAAVTHPDPYPYYADLVARQPLYYDEALRLWVASSAAAVSAVLGSDLCRVRPLAEPVPRALLGSPAGDLFGRFARMNDGAYHVASKRAVGATMHSIKTAQVIEQGRIWARFLLDGRQPQTASRSLQDFAFHLPVYVLASLLGVPQDRLYHAALWIRDFARCLAPGSGAEQIERGKAAAGHLLALFRSLLSMPQAGRSENLLEALAEQAKDAGCEDRESIVANGIGFVFQAYEATAGLIGNTLVALVAHPEVYAQVVADAGLLPDVIQETLRCDSPVQNTRRFLAQDGLVAGQEMRAGDVALVVLAAANRDPAVNPHPERFDVGRRDRRIFTFGAGVHACPGDALAALIAQAGVEALMIFRRDLASLIKPVSYRPSANVRIALLGNR